MTTRRRGSSVRCCTVGISLCLSICIHHAGQVPRCEAVPLPPPLSSLVPARAPSRLGSRVFSPASHESTVRLQPAQPAAPVGGPFAQRLFASLPPSLHSLSLTRPGGLWQPSHRTRTVSLTSRVHSLSAPARRTRSTALCRTDPPSPLPSLFRVRCTHTMRISTLALSSVCSLALASGVVAAGSAAGGGESLSPRLASPWWTSEGSDGFGHARL